jgi:hypothetical protein
VSGYYHLPSSFITMRTIIDLEEEQLQRLDAWALQERISRAEAVRRAVQQLLQRSEPAADAGFGLWRQAGPLTPERDGLALQQALRDEWPR